MKIKNLVISGAVVGSLFTGIAFVGNQQIAREVEAKKLDNLADAERCIAVHNSKQIKGLPPSTKACDRVDADLLTSSKRTEFETAFALHEKEQAKAKAEAARVKAEAEKAEKARIAAAAKAKADAEAKFRAEGWIEVENGIYRRWCTSGPNPCSSAGVIGDASYVLAEIWCKERACGDIYGRINLLDSNDTVVGWTNDTAYGGLGQRVVLTFDTYQTGWTSAQLTELSFR